MIIRKLLSGAVIACVMLAFAMPIVAQEGEGGADMESMMAEWAKYMTPGEHHKHMAKMVGEWDVASKMWMGPGEPMETKGTATFTSEFGGLYIRHHYKSEFMGQSFEGQGLMGYDIYAGEHVSTWHDNMSSGIYMSRGTCNAEDKTMTSMGTMDDPMTGRKDVHFKEVIKTIDDDHFVFSMYELGDDGSETKTMEMTYTRKK